MERLNSNVIASEPLGERSNLAFKEIASSCFASLAVLAMTILFVLMAASAHASTALDVKKGNMLYNSKKYDEAIKVYDNALDRKSDNAMLRFNKGDALYKKGS
ncbi:MAG: tetratricopeptide repeat protein, partial [Candidatus Omnitrophica bacterium]|nr:tetratricopeptide repeat protein [Candidatus Omnitrophota bacterium]